MNKKLKDYFIPTQENDYAPHGLQKAAMVGMLFLIILSFTATNALSLMWISSKWMVSTVLPAVIVDLTNDERGELGTLKRNSVLDNAAKLKAEHMAKNQYFSHYSPEGVSPWHWFGQVSYNFVHAGENLAIHFSDSGEVVDAWMESPTHRANIMNGNYTEIGVGTAEGTYQGFQTVYVVQLFGTPAAAVASNTVAPEAAPEVKVTQVEPEEVEEEEDEEVLAESVSITEEVEFIEAEPVPTEVEGETISEEEVTENVIADTQATGTEVANMEVTQQGVALYSDFISTSTGGIAATAGPTGTEKIDTTPFYLQLATQPHMILQISYIFIGTLVLGSLLLSIFIEIRRQQPLQIAYGAGLMALMFGLFYIHTVVSSGAFIV